MENAAISLRHESGLDLLAGAELDAVSDHDQFVGRHSGTTSTVDGVSMPTRTERSMHIPVGADHSDGAGDIAAGKGLDGTVSADSRFSSVEHDSAFSPVERRPGSARRSRCSWCW